MIGATTENPSLKLLPHFSRCRILVLEQLKEKELKNIGSRALKYLKKKIDKEAEMFLLEASNGDARVLLNVLRSPLNSPALPLKLVDIETALQRRQLTLINGEKIL